MEEKSLQVVNVEDFAMNAFTIQRQVNIIQEVMQQVMKSGEHYGSIPGCGNKPTLLKPGAEKLGLTFRFAPSYDISKADMPDGHREYMIVCTLTHINSGFVVGQGVGSCSTMEGKYRYRKAGHKCPSCKKEDTIIKGKKEYGGGWVCFAKKGGCGAKFKDGDKDIEGQDTGRVEHDNPADYYNTVLKMGKKRAHVDAILTATAASDLFTQDIEDMPEVIPGSIVKETPKAKPTSSQKKQNAVTPKRMAYDALLAEGLSDSDVMGIIEFVTATEGGESLTDATLKDIATRTQTYINEWKSAQEIGF
jgi:hypothetical protein